MKKLVPMLVSAALLLVGLVARPSDNTAVTPPAATPPVEVVATGLILDGGFEAAPTDWTFTGDSTRLDDPAFFVKTGKYCAALANEKKGFAAVSQTINVPTKGTTSLKYSVRIESNEKPGISSANLVVKVNETVINTLTPANQRGEYRQYSYDLSKFPLTSVNIEFKGTFNNSVATLFCIDDVIASNSR